MDRGSGRSSSAPSDFVDAEVIKTRLEAIEAAVERIEGKLDAVLAALTAPKIYDRGGR